MKSLIHVWGILLVVISSVIGVFLMPYICWLFDGNVGYMGPYVVSIILLLVSVIWFMLRKRGELMMKFIMLYISLALFIPSFITALRFDFNSINSINDCISVRGFALNSCYNKFGIYKFNYEYKLEVVRNTNGEKCMYAKCHYNDKYCRYTIVYDSYGNYIESIPHIKDVDQMYELNQYGYR